MAPAATRVSPTSWPLTPVAEPAGPLEPRRAHTPSGPRQSADDAQQQQLLERPRDTERKTKGPCPESVVRRTRPYAFAMRQRVRKPRGPPPLGQGTRAPSSFWRVAPATPRTGNQFGSASSLAVPDRGIRCARGGCHLAGRGWIAAPQLDLRFGGAGSVASSGVVRPGGRRSRACRCSLAVVPADPIARRWVPSQHFLDDAGAGPAVG